MRRTVPLLSALALALFATALFNAPALAERRIALVIGNAAYPSAPLKNPVHDARDMAAALKSLGFEVIQLENAGLSQMEGAVNEFWTRLKKGGAGLFYFAGHGLQVAGRNYLVPVDARLHAEQDARYKCMDAGLVLGRMEDAGNGLNIVILDACRNNPFARSWRSSSEGLAKMDAPKGSIIAYATAPDSVAADGAGKNGLYTEKLLAAMRAPGQPVEQMFKRVRDEVMRATGDKQVPWESTSLRGDFFFAPDAGGAAAPQPAPPSAPPQVSKPAPPQVLPPGKGRLNLSDIDQGAAERDRAEREAKRQWADRLKAMQDDFRKLQDVEKSPKYAAADRAEAWQRFLSTYGEKNPYGVEDQALRDKAEARRSHWLAMAKPPASAPAAPAKPTVPSKVGKGQTWREPVTQMEFVSIPQGCFQMGSPATDSGHSENEGPLHEACVSGFWLARHPVTVGQFRTFVQATGYKTFAEKDGELLTYVYPGAKSESVKGKGLCWSNPGFPQDDRHPVVGLSWFDAKAFAKWLSEKGGGTFRLPTEAEWEYAARAGTTGDYYWTPADAPVCRFANTRDKAFARTLGGGDRDCDDGHAYTSPVGSFPPNPWGLHDMLGNVRQWCEDTHDVYGPKSTYGNMPRENPVLTGGKSESYHYLRGDSWGDFSLRISFRHIWGNVLASSSNGFRLVRLP